jgi:cyclic pyranopterin phosphate synthase
MNQIVPLMAETTPMVDPFGRSITYLRVSVTDRCDFRCVYCMAEDMTFLPKRDVLSLEELDRLCSAFIAKGVRRLRLTGGEPLVRRNIMSLVRSLGRHIESGQLDELTLTTNGSQLARFASELADAGVRRINVSIDTLDSARFRAITRWGDLDKVMAGLDAAQAAGLKVKINAVALKGVNEYEIDDLLRFAHGRGMDLTLIETMPLGEIEGDRTEQYLPLSTVRARLEEQWTLTDIPYKTGGPARYVEVAETGGRLGFITPLTHNLRNLQPGARHLHGHAVHVPRPGGRDRPACAAARVRERRAAFRRYRRGDRAQAQGARFHHRPRSSPPCTRSSHEHDRRLIHPSRRVYVALHTARCCPLDAFLCLCMYFASPVASLRLLRARIICGAALPRIA